METRRLHRDEPLGPLYVVTDKFDPVHADDWSGYIKWSGLTQLTEVVSLDSMLCPAVVDGPSDKDWSHIVNEHFMLDYFVDLPALLQRAGPISDKNVLCVFRNPPAPPKIPAGFTLVGYDLVDVLGTVSALVNCGGFPEVFENRELSQYGLIASLERAQEIQRDLRARHPNGEHSMCHVWAVSRQHEP